MKIVANSGIFPVIAVEQITDERWQELAERNAMQNYFREFGEYPETTEEALIWQRRCVK